MKQLNWQTKALTLFIAALALWLTAACANVDTANPAPLAEETTETPTQAATDTPTVEAPTQQDGCSHETPGLRSWQNTTEEEYVESLSGAWWFSRDVRDKYEDLFWRQPNVYDVSIGQLRDNQGELTETWGITVRVTEKVDQNSLPPEDWIPEILDDVRILILETKPQPKVPDGNCDYSKCGVDIEKGEESMTNPNTNPREERAERARRQARELKVRDKYEPLFRRQPNVYSTGVGYFTDENGKLTEMWGIIVRVTEKVDQNTLPPEDRIPDCLEGIPVQIEEREPPIIEQGSREKGEN